MQKTVRLGSTGILAAFNGFGALPIQRCDMETAVRILRRAYDCGVNYFDTARAYTDSEEKLGRAFGDMGARETYYLASKTRALTPAAFWDDLETSLRLLRTDYLDVYQFHNPPQIFRLGDGTGMYEAALEAKAKGLIRHIGFTNHSLALAREGVESGLYETLQFPFSYLTGAAEIALVESCRAHDVGFIAMKALAGGLITNAAAAYAALAQYDNVLPIWGIQRMQELEEFLALAAAPPQLTDARKAVIEADRKALAGDFCRGCGYCQPCTVGIDLHNAARMPQLIRRSPSAPYLAPEWQAEMKKIENCTGCGLCASRCPYGLDTPALIRKAYADYQNLLSGKASLDSP